MIGDIITSSFGHYFKATNQKPGKEAENDEDTSAQRFEGCHFSLLETFESSQFGSFKFLNFHFLGFQLTCDAKSYLGMI